MNNFRAEELVETHEDCTLLFADVAGFTAYSSSVEPSDVVKMVSALFTDFD
jgi:class 3 adenylate cyclase